MKLLVHGLSLLERASQGLLLHFHTMQMQCGASHDSRCLGS